MKLIEEWRKGYRLFSVQAMALATALLGAWAVLPDDLRTTLPHWVPNLAGITILVAGILGRLVQQTPPALPVDPDATAPGLPPNGH